MGGYPSDWASVRAPEQLLSEAVTGSFRAWTAPPLLSFLFEADGFFPAFPPVCPSEPRTFSCTAAGDGAFSHFSIRPGFTSFDEALCEKRTVYRLRQRRYVRRSAGGQRKSYRRVRRPRRTECNGVQMVYTARRVVAPYGEDERCRMAGCRPNKKQRSNQPLKRLLR